MVYFQRGCLCVFSKVKDVEDSEYICGDKITDGDCQKVINQRNLVFRSFCCDFSLKIK